MNEGVVRLVDPSEQAGAVDVITLAFSADPILRWSFPDPTTYLAVMPRIVRYFGGRALDHDSAWLLEGCRGAVLILPPGVMPDFDELFALNEQYVAPDVLPDLAGVYEAMEGYHPSTAHWHLAWTGIDPAVQGRGLGSLLVAHALRQCDLSGLPVYLESTSRQSLPFYERLGFEQLGRIQHGASPPMFPMLRQPGAGF